MVVRVFPCVCERKRGSHTLSECTCTHFFRENKIEWRKVARIASTFSVEKRICILGVHFYSNRSSNTRFENDFLFSVTHTHAFRMSFILTYTFFFSSFVVLFFIYEKKKKLKHINCICRRKLAFVNERHCVFSLRSRCDFAERNELDLLEFQQKRCKSREKSEMNTHTHQITFDFQRNVSLHLADEWARIGVKSNCRKFFSMKITHKLFSSSRVQYISKCIFIIRCWCSFQLILGCEHFNWFLFHL